MDILGCDKTQPRMIVLGVVPGEEGLRKCPGMFDRAEPLGELRSILHGLELGFGIGVVIAHRWSGVTLGDTEIGKEKRNGL